MAVPDINFSYSPLSGKAPLEVTFINLSDNLGGDDEWAACPLGQKYLYSPLTDIGDPFALDFNVHNDVVSTYDSNGFRVESTGIHYPGEIIEEESVGALINCDDDFDIELTVNSFRNWHGSIQLYFDSITVGIFTVNPGIHINTSGGTGIVRGINNAGNVANLVTYTKPVKVKFKKEGASLRLYVNDEQIDTIATSLMGLDSGNHSLTLKMIVQNDVTNWYMGIKDIYILNSNMPSSCQGSHVEYLWDFGDGTTSTEEHPVHIFEEEDIYAIQLDASNEEGAGDFVVKSLVVSGESEGLENADEIFQEHYREIVKNVDDIPNYCSNQDLRKLINAAILDAMRHADVIQDNVTARMHITVSEIYDGIRTMKCDTNFLSGLHTAINKTLVRRTIVEPEKQNDVASSTFEFE